MRWDGMGWDGMGGGWRVGEYGMRGECDMMYGGGDGRNLKRKDERLVDMLESGLCCVSFIER